MPRFQADILTLSCDDASHNNAEAIRGEPYIITHPGEYETKGIFVYGIPASPNGQQKNTVYKIISEEISVAHLGNLSSQLTDEQVDRLGNVDVLLIPVGGGNSLDSKKANEIISQIEPRLVVPMNYKIDGQKSDLATADDFIKNCGLKSETSDKLKLAKKDLLTEDTRVIILTV